MDRRVIGTTDIDVSAFCLGTWMFGRAGNPDAAECTRMIHTALDAGITFIDTADAYSDGDAERIVGQAIRGRRTDVVVVGKVGYPTAASPAGGLSATALHAALEASLQRLGTDYLDLYLLHRPDPATPIEETLGALDDLAHAGKIRAAGCSTFPAWQIAEMRCSSSLHAWEPLQCEQPPYSILVRGAERDVFPAAARCRMGIMAWSPLAGGWLTGKYAAAAPPAGSRGARAAEFARENPRIAERYDLAHPANRAKFAAVERLTAIAAHAGISLAAMSLAFTQAHPAVTSTVLGARTPGQLDELIGAVDLRLDAPTLDAIDEVVPPGTVLNDADRGWDPPWMERARRRR